MKESEIQMDSEIPPFSCGQNPEEPEVPLSEAIMSLLQTEIQALKQVEIASTQLLQVLERQVMEGETLRTQLKQRRDIPKTLKNSYKEQYWWDSLAVEIKGYGEQCEGYRVWLESIQETCGEKMSAFKQLQEDVNNLSSQ